MKRFIVLFVCLFYLDSATDIHQLLRLPLLFEHFVQHQRDNRNLTFEEFLNIHYNSPFKKDADYEQDMKLPFKSVHCESMHVTAAVTSIPQYQFHCKSTDLSSNYLIKDEEMTGKDIINFIWQPPKAC